MKLKISKTLFALTMLVIESSANDKTLLDVITESSAEHQSLSQAVIEIIGSLEGDRPSATNVIKVTSFGPDARSIDPFTETIVKNINGPFEFHIQNDEDMRQSSEHKAMLVVFDVKTIREMEIFLSSLKVASQCKVLIVLLNKSFPSSRNNIKLMLDIMWRKFILNVHVVTSSEEQNDDVQLHTFFPFNEDFCGQVHPVVWNIYRNQAFVMLREHFPRKDENLFQCALRVAVFNAPPYMTVLEKPNEAIDVDGIDGKLLKTLSHKLNFTINYTIVSEDVRWGEIYYNHTATGAFQLVSETFQGSAKLLITFYYCQRFSTTQSISLWDCFTKQQTE